VKKKDESKKEKRNMLGENSTHTKSNIQKGNDVMPEDLNYIVLQSFDW